MQDKYSLKWPPGRAQEMHLFCCCCRICLAQAGTMTIPACTKWCAVQVSEQLMGSGGRAEGKPVMELFYAARHMITLCFLSFRFPSMMGTSCSIASDQLWNDKWPKKTKKTRHVQHPLWFWGFSAVNTLCVRESFHHRHTETATGGGKRGGGWRSLRTAGGEWWIRHHPEFS